MRHRISREPLSKVDRIDTFAAKGGLQSPPPSEVIRGHSRTAPSIHGFLKPQILHRWCRRSGSSMDGRSNPPWHHGPLARVASDGWGMARLSCELLTHSLDWCSSGIAIGHFSSIHCMRNRVSIRGPSTQTSQKISFLTKCSFHNHSINYEIEDTHLIACLAFTNHQFDNEIRPALIVIGCGGGGGHSNRLL